MFDSNQFFGAQADEGFYPETLDGSLRFNDDDNAYLSRTFGSSSNRKTWTWSAWIKRANFGASFGDDILFNSNSGSTRDAIRLEYAGALRVYFNNASSGDIKTNALLRDPSAWYHLVVVVDTTQSTSSNRVKIYINGVLQTSLATSSYPSQNYDGLINRNSVHAISSKAETSSDHFDGYLSNVHFIDGTALDADSFGETKSGVWIPKAYTGTYGTNGFHLPLDADANDDSGNGNNWTENNLAATDYVLDSPTNNFATLNPLTKLTSQVTLSEGNLKADAASGGSNWGTVFSTMSLPSTGKYYIECVAQVQNGSGNRGGIGVIDSSDFTPTNTDYVWDETTGEGFDGIDMSLFSDIFYSISDGVSTSRATGLTATSYILMLAVDIDNGKVFTGYDGTWVNSGNPVSGTGQTADRTFSTSDVIAVHTAWNGTNDQRGIANFGQDSSFAGNKTPQGNTDANGIGDFYYAPPAGYLALCTSNLPEPAIGPNSSSTSDEHFNTVLYTGDEASSHAITGVGFQPDLVWMKMRSGAYEHVLYDVVRGVGGNGLYSNDTAVEGAYSTYHDFDSFDSDGFTIGDAAGAIDIINELNDSFVAWNWKANGSGVSNTDGSITSTVSANTEAGFSIVGVTTSSSFSGTETAGHGLSKKPELVITKRRTNSTNWWVHTELIDGSYDYLSLNTTNAKLNDTYTSGTPTSTVIPVSATFVNSGSGDIIYYCFHSVEGFSKLGSYTGNGSTDGPFVYCGFRPAFVLYKNTDNGSADWEMYDGVRDPYNVADAQLYPNSSSAEVHSDRLDFVSNGIKIRSSGGGVNQSGSNFIFMAFAENPFKYTTAR